MVADMDAVTIEVDEEIRQHEKQKQKSDCKKNNQQKVWFVRGKLFDLHAVNLFSI